jgi:drug/metabolite transporter (DMT)-like permease
MIPYVLLFLLFTAAIYTVLVNDFPDTSRQVLVPLLASVCTGVSWVVYYMVSHYSFIRVLHTIMGIFVGLAAGVLVSFLAFVCWQGYETIDPGAPEMPESVMVSVFVVTFMITTYLYVVSVPL